MCVGQPYAIDAWASSWFNAAHHPKFAWSAGPRYFHSARENNPWVRVQLNEPTKIKSVTVGNRKDHGGRLRNLEIRAGMKNDLTNEIVGKFKGPGRDGAKHVILLREEVTALYISFQIKVKEILQIRGIWLNEDETLGECKIICYYLIS